MADPNYDIITVGGGLAGAALAKVMAEGGYRVLVLERETAFRDRVRGEAMMPWGTAEAQKLGVYDAIMSSTGHELRWWDGYQGSSRSTHRDLVGTSTPKTSVTAFHHPYAQEALIQAAAQAGAEVQRGARVDGVTPGRKPTVSAQVDGKRTVFETRLVVGADGRESMVRRWGGFNIRHDPEINLVAGVLLDNVLADDQAAHAWLNSDLGQWVLLFPQGRGLTRAYVCYPEAAGYRLTGGNDIARFVEESLKSGVLPEVFAEAKPAGPLATFDGAAIWTPHPYLEGVALIGGAAAAPDPTWGQGMSLSFMDARVLRDQLLADDDWEVAGNAYALEHDQYYGVIHDVESWQTQLLLEPGPAADERRVKAFASWREDRSRQLDTMISGPGPTLTEGDRRRYFGED